MTEPTASPMSGWRYGIHPRATGMRVHALGRVDLPLGEALRIEMVSADPGGDDTVHLQYYIATEAGPWAIWVSCPRSELAGREASLTNLNLPITEE